MNRLLPSRLLTVSLAPALLLGGCGQSSAPQAASTASGEILPGSVSDAMLDTDRTQAQAPLAPAARSTVAKGDASTAVEASDPAGDAAANADAGPADAAPASPKAAASAKPANP